MPVFKFARKDKKKEKYISKEETLVLNESFIALDVSVVLIIIVYLYNVPREIPTKL